MESTMENLPAHTVVMSSLILLPNTIRDPVGLRFGGRLKKDP